MQKTIIAAAVFGLFATAAQAEDFTPGAGHSINLGAVSGAAYYTVESQGLRLVATLAATNNGEPVRFISTLADGQSVTLSVPAVNSHDAKEMTFRRAGDRVILEKAPDLRAALAN
ncbi:hypothetical protein LQ948_00945 [Jiella sp. MQZ9-1]|uniref:Uncharacterized protein n=1 Tax=Jiella flava TaxID=2816857 RepID=A0A939JQQ9_9HYPH|nr:hypothetical protein [Jiella flava]MBO0661128.1 hypothetical protein [Jiella flava]MCD2469774.1 hypothetical protein [Jiella flava]